MMKTQVNLAADLFLSGFNCAQSVLAVFCEKYGLPQKDALKTASGFGAGVRNGEICGAVSGAVMVIGLKYGQYKAEDKESKQKCNEAAEAFICAFKNRNKSIICRDIIGCDLSTTQGRQLATEKNLFQTVCSDMVKSAVEQLCDLGY